jgi:hypothetical protein
MGHIVHHSIIATTFDVKLAEELGAFCRSVGASACITTSNINGYITVFVGPDGSKSWWRESDEGDARRALIKDKIRSFNYEDGSNPFSWVEVSYSSDEGKAEITDSRWTIEDKSIPVTTYALKIYPEECCEHCNEITHNHFDCPVCETKYASSDQYCDLSEVKAPVEIECESCEAMFRLVNGTAYNGEWICIAT